MGGICVLIIIGLMAAVFIGLIILAIILIFAAITGVGGGVAFLFAGNKLISKDKNPNAVLLCKILSAVLFIVAIVAAALLITGIIYFF